MTFCNKFVSILIYKNNFRNFKNKKWKEQFEVLSGFRSESSQEVNIWDLRHSSKELES